MSLSTGVLDVGTLPDDERPLILFDVDGVINIFNGSQNHKRYAWHQIGPYRIQIRHELSGWLEELVEHFIPVWCTMWDDAANIDLCPILDWPSLPYIPCADTRDTVIEWNGVHLHSKIGPITDHVGDRSFVWIDDEITKNDMAWSSVRDNELAPTLLVQTDDRVGLERYHVDRLIKWADLIK